MSWKGKGHDRLVFLGRVDMPIFQSRPLTPQVGVVGRRRGGPLSQLVGLVPICHGKVGWGDPAYLPSLGGGVSRI